MRPSILVPYAVAAGDHQTANARGLAEAEADRRGQLLDTLLDGYDEADQAAAGLLRRAGYLQQRQSYCVALARSVDPGEMESSPRAQRMADAIADLSNVKLETVRPDRVKVTGFRGKPRPDNLKLCIGYRDGWLGESEISVCWPDAYEKAQFCESFLRGRFKQLEIPIVESRFDYIGLNSIHGPLSPMPSNLDEINEIRLRVAVKTTSREYANQVRREVTHLWTHGPVGTTAVISPPPPRENRWG